MKWSTTLWLLVLALLLGALIWLGERERGGRPVAGEENPQVLRFAARQVEEVEIEQDALALYLVRKDAGWFLVKPVQGRADAGEVERILGVLETLHRREVVTEEDRRQRDLGLGDYGLAPPRARIVVRDSAGKHELLVGGDAPLGGMVYVKPAVGNDLFAVSRDVLTALPQGLEKLRDRIILPGDAARTARLEIQRTGGGLVQLAPSRTGWMIQQPVSLRADGARVQRMLDGLYTLRAERFVWDPPPAGTVTQAMLQSAASVADDARLETYGLAADAAQLRIQVWAPGDQVGKELRIGKPIDETATLLYAKQRDQSAIYAVSSAITNLFGVTVNDLRDRNLFALEAAKIRNIGFQAGDRKLMLARDEKSGWNIMEPVQWKADDEVVEDLAQCISRLRIEAAIESAETNLATYRLDAAEFILTVSDAAASETNAAPPPEPAPAAPAQDDTRLLVSRAEQGSETSYVMFKNARTVLAVAEASLQPLRLRLTDPLLYRNRTMLALRPADIWRIVLSKGGKEQAVARGEKGDWAAVGSSAFTVNQEAVADILALVGRLRAVRIESHNPRHLASYGLDRTGVSLSFNLTGSEGIQRTLILGFRARTDGIYAMIQGQDVVFVLANAGAERLTRDLLLPVPRDAVAPAAKSDTPR